MPDVLRITCGVPLFSCLVIAGGAQRTSPPGNATNRVNPGWYGWLGDFHDVRGYYPRSCDRAYFLRHNVNWFWLGHQWAVPYLESGTCKVKEAILENKERARIWYELYWWGDHSHWGGWGTREGFSMGHVPPFVLAKLEEAGIRPGGDDIRGKDWMAVADDPRVMASVKKTIQWQIDTILRHCGRDALYGVVLSEEEPDHGVNSTLGQERMQYYGEHRDEVLPKLIRVHNELYDFVKERYPFLKVSPGFYPHWVEPGTLKMDAVVMDLYPPPGKEEEYIERWGKAYGFDVEQYVLLWGYGEEERRTECTRFDRMVEGLLARGVKNLGVFRAELALQDRIHRLFDVHGVGDYRPYDIERHRRNAQALLPETQGVVAALPAAVTDALGSPPTPSADAWASRAAICQWTDSVYTYREAALEFAYGEMCRVASLAELPGLIAVLRAEHLVGGGLDCPAEPAAAKLAEWEGLSKEFGGLPRFYAAVEPVRLGLAACATLVAAEIDARAGRLGERVPEQAADRFSSAVQQLASSVRKGRVREAIGQFGDLHAVLRQAGCERSFLLRVVFGNRYRFPLNIKVTLTAAWQDGTQAEVYSAYPCTTAEAEQEVVLFLPQRPQSVAILTSSWTGTLDVLRWELSHSSTGIMRPNGASDARKVQGGDDWPEGEWEGFTLSPWAGVAGVTIEY